MNMQKVNLYSDGSSKGNPGQGGYGTIIHHLNDAGDVIKVEELSEGFKSTTNNRMELMGIIVGLESLTDPCDVNVFTDSSYVTDMFNKGWIKKWLNNRWKTAYGNNVKNTDLIIRLILAMKPHAVTYTWVKGHDGHSENERCDYLATTAADNYTDSEEEF